MDQLFRRRQVLVLVGVDDIWIAATVSSRPFIGSLLYGLYLWAVPA
jgi:hypothetical protein